VFPDYGISRTSKQRIGRAPTLSLLKEMADALQRQGALVFQASMSNAFIGESAASAVGT